MDIMVGENLKAFLREQGNTQEELSNHLGISVQVCRSGSAGFHIIKDTVIDITTPCLYVACFDKIDFKDNSELKYIQNCPFCVER